VQHPSCVGCAGADYVKADQVLPALAAVPLSALLLVGRAAEADSGKLRDRSGFRSDQTDELPIQPLVVRLASCGRLWTG
jgi:hypothetical protein